MLAEGPRWVGHPCVSPDERCAYAALGLADLAGRWGLWLQLVESKYLQGQPLLSCSQSAGSQFWKSIQTIKEEIRLSLRFSVGNVSGTQFWLDP